MKRRKRKGMKIIIIVLLLLLVRLFIDHRVVKVTSYEITSEKLPASFDGYKIVQLSDLHNENLTKQLIKKVDAQNPDIVVLTGDMVSAGKYEVDNFLALAKELAKKYKTYYIKGNHEGELKYTTYNEIIDELYKFGVIEMDNEKEIIQKGNDHINLYGMWVNQRYYSRADSYSEYKITSDVMTKLLANANQDEYNILLMHTPSYFDEYVKWGADLIFSGHVHGGMIRLPFLGGMFSPDRKMFPKYYYGAYQKDDATMIVNSGLSAGMTGFRLFNQPEIVVTTLKSK